MSNTANTTVPLARPAGKVVVNPTTNRIYVANGNGNSVTVIQDVSSQTNIYLPLLLRTTP